MPTIYDDTHELFRDSFRSFVEAEISPRYAEFERDGIMDRATSSSSRCARFASV